MGYIGGRAAIDLALGSGIDTAGALNFMLRTGSTAEQLIARTAVAIGAVNQELLEKWGNLIYITQMPYSYYTQGTGSRTRTQKKAEFKQADASRSNQSGHTLPLTKFEDALEWTGEYMRDAWDTQLNGDVSVKADDWRNRVTDEILERIFMNTEYAIGGGFNVGWALGTGSVPFIPVQNGNTVFDLTHKHYKGYAGAVSNTTCATALKDLTLELRHHGHSGMLDALVSDTDVDSYATMTGFVELNPQVVNVIAGNSAAPIYTAQGDLQGIPGEVFGYFRSSRGMVRLRYHERIPTGYLFVSKSYGNNNPKNGIALREHPTRGFGLYLDPQVSKSLTNPEVERILLKAEHGFGVNERTNGAAGFIGNATYQNPSSFLA